MNLAPDLGAPAPARSAGIADPGGDAPGLDAPGLRPFVFGLFFIFGGITSLNDVLIPRLKEIFTLNYTQAMLVQFCFFAAYAIVGIPGARLIRRVGYMRGAVVGLCTMMAGCLLFLPAGRSAAYPLFLLALFILASGVVVVQVVANPLISLLGPAPTAPSRLTFAQAFNSLGTTLFPIFGSALILGGLATLDAAPLAGAELLAHRQAQSAAIWQGYLGLAALIGVVAGVVWLFRNRLRGEQHEAAGGLAGLDLLGRPRFGFGAWCVFLYVGAEVAIGSIVVSFLMQGHVLDTTEDVAGPMIGFYWGGAMLGRFIGSLAMRFLRPGLMLAGAAAGAMALITLSASSTGLVAASALLCVGLMNSIMFPTIFSLACEKLGPRAADGSGILNVAICGGAIVPLVFGVVADFSGSLSVALALPAVCYAFVAGFGLYARKPA